MNPEIKPSVIEQLQSITKTLDELVNYENDVSNDLEDAIFYTKISDKIKQKIKDILKEKYNDS